MKQVCGLAPYEKRIIDILKGGGNNPTKRAWKFSKNRLGTHIRAKAKVTEMQDFIAEAAKNKKAAETAAKAK